MTNKEKYAEFCKKENTIPIFSQPWWLDAVCGENNWDIVLVENEDQIEAAMPFYKKKYFASNIITMPPLTQTLGPWLSSPISEKYFNIISREKKLMTQLIKGLPPFDYFAQHFSNTITNWLPFYWNGFTQTTRYSYIIRDLSDPEKVFSEFSHAKRKNIRRAQDSVDIRSDLDAVQFYEHHKNSLRKEGKNISYSFDLLKKIFEATHKQNAGKNFYAIDKNNIIHSTIFIIYNSLSAYYLISSIDPDYRNSGSVSLLLFHAMKYVSKYTNVFDFEGSMIEGVENSFRQFGAQQVPYFRITKMSRRFKILWHGKEMCEAIIRG